jgi:ABC-2 type transport system ATP-binding protein
VKIIETQKLTKYYNHGKILGIKNLTLDVDEGEIFGFIGPNGSGKSTTIRLLLDLIRPSSGSASIFGLNIHTETVQIKKKIGYLPGEIFLPDGLTGDSCIKYYGGFKQASDKKYLSDLIHRLDLDTKRKVKDYSKGNKQKLAVVLALMHKPKLLILDEPTSGLDPLNQAEFYKIIRETKKFGTTTFFSTHILEEAEKLCDRVGIIKEGKLLKIENIDEFRNKNIREIHIDTSSVIPLSVLKQEGVTKIERTTFGYHLITSGKNGVILKSLAKFDVEDIKVSEPSLEEIFMHYYKK